MKSEKKGKKSFQHFFTLYTLGRQRILIHFPRKTNKVCGWDHVGVVHVLEIERSGDPHPLHVDEKIEIDMGRKANSKLSKRKRKTIQIEKSLLSRCFLIGGSFRIDNGPKKTDVMTYHIHIPSSPCRALFIVFIHLFLNL